MKGLAAVYICSLLFFTASCSNHYSIDSLSIKDNVKQLIFFSDETNVQQEAAYYDAIIELRRNFPHEVENMMVFTSADGKKYYDSFEIKKSPAIIVIYNDQIVANITGNISKDQIIQTVSQALK
ncbi:small peptidoglycan-associated lipoprotein [Bacillus sp. CGMCC 1.16607]|uniref:small peptidoglycan-associated lipoprotein n=1 Tax=Bacillus sp. CGMCC 1.16607 TaxID=3351842 RepID=UPI00363D2851